jgi:hypothetical protein
VTIARSGIEQESPGVNQISLRPVGIFDGEAFFPARQIGDVSQSQVEPFQIRGHKTLVLQGQEKTCGVFESLCGTQNGKEESRQEQERDKIPLKDRGSGEGMTKRQWGISFLV